MGKNEIFSDKGKDYKRMLSKGKGHAENRAGSKRQNRITVVISSFSIIHLSIPKV